MKFILLFCLITFGLATETSFYCGVGDGTETDRVTCTYDSDTEGTTTIGTLTISGTGELSADMPWKTQTGCNNPDKLVITASITKIPDNAFMKDGKSWSPIFHKISEVQLPSTLQMIGKKAFFECNKLKTVTVDGNPTNLSIDENAFSGCTVLSTLNMKVTNKIGNFAFSNTNALETFDFSLVKEIGDEPFVNSLIKNFNFGKYLEKIGNNIFKDCEVEEITVDAENNYFSAIENVLYEKIEDKKRLIYYMPSKTDEKFTVPDDVIEIGHHSFNTVENLKHIDFGLSTETIVMGAFNNCGNLKNVTIGKSVKNIKPDSFDDCSIENYEVDECNEMFEIREGILYTKSIGNEAIVKFIEEPEITAIYEIPVGIKVIYDNAFADITTLEELTIGNDVYSIHSNAFKGCTNLKKVTITASITSVGTNVFADLTNLEEVFIGKNVKMIGNNMFNGCTQLKTVTFEEGSQLLTIERYAFRNTALTNVVIPDSVIYLMNNAFAETATLKSVTIGKNVMTIGAECFSYCQNLETVTMNSEKLLSIEQRAFYNLPKLESIIIPATVEIISNKAFEACTGLKTITYKGTDQPAFCSELSFDGVTDVTVNVESSYDKQQFCGIFVKKPNDSPAE